MQYKIYNNYSYNNYSYNYNNYESIIRITNTLQLEPFSVEESTHEYEHSESNEYYTGHKKPKTTHQDNRTDKEKKSNKEIKRNTHMFLKQQQNKDLEHTYLLFKTPKKKKKDIKIKRK